MGVSTYSTGDWRSFIDSSKTSLKNVLLNNGKRFVPVLIGHSIKVKEEYFAIKIVNE